MLLVRSRVAAASDHSVPSRRAHASIAETSHNSNGSRSAWKWVRSAGVRFAKAQNVDLPTPPSPSTIRRMCVTAVASDCSSRRYARSSSGLAWGRIGQVSRGPGHPAACTERNAVGLMADATWRAHESRLRKAAAARESPKDGCATVRRRNDQERLSIRLALRPRGGEESGLLDRSSCSLMFAAIFSWLSTVTTVMPFLDKSTRVSDGCAASAAPRARPSPSSLALMSR